MISRGHLLIQRALQGWSNRCPAGQIAPLGAEAIVDVAPLPPPHPTSAAAYCICRRGRTGAGPAWPTPCAADMLWEGWRTRNNWRTGPLPRSVLQTRGPLCLGIVSVPGSSICLLGSAARDGACKHFPVGGKALGWLACQEPSLGPGTRLPPAQVLEVSASPFTPVISFVLPRAGPDALS